MSLLLRRGVFSGALKTFISTWNTENLGGTGSATKIILLPMTAGPRVDWGDGTVNNLNTHTYSSGGVTTVKIYDSFGGFRFNDVGDKLKITNISRVGGLEVDTNAIFKGCSNMTWTALDIPNVTQIGTLSATFQSCTLFNGSVNDWDMSAITSISTFFRATAFNGDVSGWDTSTLTSIASAFRETTAFNQDISSWDVSSVTSAPNFMLDNTTFAQANYDLLLVAWEAQSVQNNVVIHFGTAKYGAGAPATARAALIADHSWTITDGGAA